MKGELPKGWEKAALGDIFEPRSTRVSPSNLPAAPYIGLEHVEAHSNRLLGTVPAATMSSSAAQFMAGDVLYGRMRPYLNKVVQPHFDGLASAEFIVFPVTAGVDSRFLRWRISATDFVGFACSQYEGDRPRVKFDQLGRFELRVPPMTEQSRIVDKLEELLSDLDAGVAELKAAQKKLAQYRQSLLKAAVEGRLTEAWRTQHGEPEESGAQLLARILRERRGRWEAKQLAKFEVQGKTPVKGWQARYVEPACAAEVNLPALPQNWTWASMEQIASDDTYSLAIGPFGSNLKVPDYRDSGVPLVFVRNIRSGCYGGAFTKYVSQDKALELGAHSIKAGDVVITKMGEPPGDADVYPMDQPPAVITADCIKVSCNAAMMNAQFLAWTINSEIGKQQIRPMTQGVAQKKVSLGRFSRLSVPLAPMSEQLEIVELTSIALRDADDQRKAINHALRQAAAQRKNILQAAFSGQLVRQDPNDEPASVLLERIRAERAASPTRTRKALTRNAKERA